MTIPHRALFVIVVATITGLCIVGQPAVATPVGYAFDASLQTGVLAGATFSGSFTYDDAGASGIGKEFLFLTSLDFTLLGVPFSLADIKQGGQAILQDGALSYFTAAFLPPPPANSPVSDIAFGFGGPGVIGYAMPPGLSDIATGQYILHPRTIPAPSSLACLALGLAALAATSTRRRFVARRQTSSTPAESPSS